MSPYFEKFVRSASWVMWLGRGMFFAVIVVLLLMRSVVTVIRIDGHSMDPTLADGEWVIVDLTSKHFQTWQRGDIAILRFPGDPLHSLYVKRVIGLPGDTVQLRNGSVLRNGAVITETYLEPGTPTEEGVVALPDVIPSGEVLVFGDNRSISNDSRYFGLVPEHDLIGKVALY